MVTKGSPSQVMKAFGLIGIALGLLGMAIVSSILAAHLMFGMPLTGKGSYGRYMSQGAMTLQLEVMDGGFGLIAIVGGVVVLASRRAKG